MNNKKKLSRPSIDGITLKRREREADNKELGLQSDSTTSSLGESHGTLPRPQVSDASIGLRKSDVDESLRAIDDNAERPSKKKQKKDGKKKVWYRRKSRIAAIVVVLLLLVGGIYMYNKFAAAAGRMFNGNVFDLFGSGVELKKDSNGWTNILVFGTSEDDAGHSGAALTDSVMVVSVNQTTKKATMVSMPRDLWVSYDTDCQFGYQGKINVVYQCAGAVDGDLSNINVATGTAALQKKVGEVFGLDIQYYVKVNYSVVRDITTALGGVTVTVESSDPRGIYDYNTKLKLPNGPATLQGEQALAFVRARGDGGGYGFEGSNFAREKNQQKMLVAIRDKALSAGTLANPAAVSSLLDALGNNIQTNFSTAEVKTLANLGQGVAADQIVNISLVDDENPVVTTGMYNGQSIVRPIAGISDYTDIQAYIQEKMNGGSVRSEAATIEILNGSGIAGAAGTQQTTLNQAGFTNTTTGNTTYKPNESLVWYDLSGGQKPKTAEKLMSTLGKSSAGTSLPDGVQSTANFVVIVGSQQ